jgi:uncharacterized protein HemY
LLLRTRRLRRRGEYRKAAIALRQLLFREPSAARWVQLGFLLSQAGRPQQSIDAYKQGKWLHVRAGNARKATVIDALITAPAVVLAA